MPSVPVPPDYITNGYGFPMQTTSCTWPYVVPIGEDPAAHGHWCAFTDLYHIYLYHTIIFFLRSLYYKGEVIGFRLFRATVYSKFSSFENLNGIGAQEREGPLTSTAGRSVREFLSDV